MNMQRFDDAVATFEHAIERANHMVSLFDALSAIRRLDPANDDALRSAYFQAVSSFDFFAHELAAIEARHRFTNGLRTRNISLPMEIITVRDDELRLASAEAHIRQGNSYKAFVDPAKLAEMLSCYTVSPWQKICQRMNSDLPDEQRRAADQVKGQLKSIWKRRNQIAHEADVNPTLAGIGLWPIFKQDTELTIEFLRHVGEQLPFVIAGELEAVEDEDISRAS